MEFLSSLNADLLLNLLGILWQVVLVLVLFGGTVLVHELGHFLTAKWLGLKIEAFSIGMGPALWSREHKGVVYRIGALPIGGYVALPQMDITGNALKSDKPGRAELPGIPPWKKIIVALAGATMNVLLAVVLCYTIYLIGKPYNPSTTEARIAIVEKDSSAYAAGLRDKDLVVRANGERVRNWNDLFMVARLYDEVELQVKRGGDLLTFTVPTVESYLGFTEIEGIAYASEVKVGKVVPGKPAERAGVKVDDVLWELDGERVMYRAHFYGMIQATEGRPTLLTVLRGPARQPVEIPLQSEYDETDKAWYVGIHMELATVHPEPWGQMRFFAGTIFRTLKALVTPREAKRAGEQLGGPVMILYSFWDVTRLPLGTMLWFTALINVNLAIINLLPLIILDGGHIMVALYEWVRGRPPRPSIVTAMANTMVVLLLGLVIFLSVRDTSLIGKIHRGPEAPAATPQPATP